MSLSSPSPLPPTEPSPPFLYVYVPETRFEIWLVAHVKWLHDPTTSFFFWHRLYRAFVLTLATIISSYLLWILPSCYLPNHWKAVWVAGLSWLVWNERNGWMKRAAEFRRRKEERERGENEKLESGFGEGLVDETVCGLGEKGEKVLEVV